MADPLDRSKRVYIAGHRGMVGSALWRLFLKRGFTDLIGATSTELDLRGRNQTREFFEDKRPEVVVLAAARVGGILANNSYPADFLSDNQQIQLNVLDAAVEYGAERLLFLGSSCIYPKFAPQPIPEESLLTGELEATNDAYAIAKISGIFHVQAIRRQHGLRFISAMPTNLYGPGDNYDPERAHVLPALIRRYHEAKMHGEAGLTNWGTGSPRREFLHVDDLADACLFLLENYDDPSPINVGVGKDLTVRELADLIAKVVGFQGVTSWDPSKPDGTPRKLLDVSKLTSLGWTYKIELRTGLRATYQDYIAHNEEPVGAYAFLGAGGQLHCPPVHR
jgi:GDP-L-fucose synthase